jgi:queuine tRNA-ribosyltransferase
VDLNPHQRLFPIVQGGMDAALRTDSARRTLAIKPDAAGYAVGGLAVGEAKSVTYRMLEASIAELPEDRPRYMMGIGTPQDLVWAVDRGVDLFDCVLPTRNARNARVFVPGGALNLRNAQHREDPRPLMEGCDCHACREGFSRAYLHHLHRADEMLAGILSSIHNIRFLLRQCGEMRAAIAAGKWSDYKAAFFSVYKDMQDTTGEE